MIISLSGAPGSGKSTIAQMLADKFGWTRYYMGGLRREAAKKRGMTLAEYNKLGESDPQTDQEVDYYQRDLGKKEDNFIIEGRTSWHFIPHSLKIYLDVNAETGARRIFGNLKRKNERNEDNDLNTWQDVQKSNRERLESDQTRYKQYYGIDVYDRANYDYYLNTSKMSPSAVFKAVSEYVAASLDKRNN